MAEPTGVPGGECVTTKGMKSKIDGAFWRALEGVRGQCALPVIWKQWLGDDFEHFQLAFFQSLPDQPAESYPCPRQCGCWHEVVVDENSNGVSAVCRCEESDCDDFEVTARDIIPSRLSWPKLARSLREALGLQGNMADLGLAHTLQVGAWSADAVPVVLSIAYRAAELRYVSAALAARWCRPFILLAPTAQFMDAPHQEFLANAGAAFFALESIMSLGPHEPAKLRAFRPPGELFAQFNPQPRGELAEDTARQALVLIERFESKYPLKQPSVLTVFRLYCQEELSVGQIVRKCRASRATVLRRLEAIRQVTGTQPRDLRRYSSHLERIEEEVSDHRARRVYRKGLVGDSEEED